MTGRWHVVLVRLGLLFGAVWLSFTVLVDPWRAAEARVISAVLRGCGVSAVQSSFHNQILVVPSGHRPFVAAISTSCSALGAVLAFAGIAAFMVRGIPLLRIRAFVRAALLVTVCNLVRIAVSVLIGAQLGARGLVLFHDWAGTAFGILYVLGGFTLFVFTLLPSNKQLLEEAMAHG